MSFGEATFNFKKNSSMVKNFISIYGENGSGKSNFVKSIDLLCRTLSSFSDAKKYANLEAILKNNEKTAPADLVNRILRENDIQYQFSSCRMIGCDEPTEIEYGFLLNGREGKYRISFSDRILNESLYYFTGKQRGYLFRLSADDDEIKKNFWSGLFFNEKAKADAVEEIQKFWGKHTFLGIVTQQRKELNYSYIKNCYSKYLLDVIKMLMDTTVIGKISNRHNTGFVSCKPINILDDLRSGKISEDSLQSLERSERILRSFFTQTYADIKNVSYEKAYLADGEIKYQLFVDKMIAGKVRRISFENESAGTQQILDIVKMLLGLFCGVTVVYDEIDNGIHDVLLNCVITSLMDEISGQLIITTHNTLLLETIDPKSAYVICVDYQGNKDVKCIDDFPLQNTNNARKIYNKGLLGGIPYIDGIDYDEIIEEIEDIKGDK